ncbi:MAG TPA: hypothetical protein VGQ59_03805 [Cyclobacteriaceae bacterium]|jgi:hypothetical protein|nr:hypothetical protein [Cyclobacteriaceae bacterium]
MHRTAELLRNDGTYLLTIEYNGLQVSLYSLEEEFYEVYYNTTRNAIEKVIQATQDDLKKYLNGIALKL